MESSITLPYSPSPWRMPDYLRRLMGSKINLFPFQLDAVMWMYSLEHLLESHPGYLHGAILADGTGLGKTLEITGLLCLRKRPCNLILTTKSTIHSWIMELLHNTDLPIYTSVGYTWYRCHLNSEGYFNTVPETVEHGSVLVTNHHSVMTKPDLFNHTFDRIIMDEAHNLHSGKSQMSKTFQNLARDQPTIRYALTATPISNSFREIAQIFKWIDPRAFTETAQIYNIEYMSQMVSNFLFRRRPDWLHPGVKALIQFPEQPPIFKTLWISTPTTDLGHFIQNLTPEEIVSTLMQRPEIVNQILADETAFILVMYVLIQRQPAMQRVSDLHRLTSSLHIMSDPLLHHQRFTGQSSKDLKVIQEIRSRSLIRVVIFFQHHATRDHYKDLITKYLPQYTLRILDGGSSAKSRLTTAKACFIDSERGQPFILLASLGAMGEGCNFQFADVLFLTSHDWNPQAELQAHGRLYRTGQKKQVEIIQVQYQGIPYQGDLVMLNQRILEVKDYKTHLANFIDHYNAAMIFPRYPFVYQGQLVPSVNFVRDDIALDSYRPDNPVFQEVYGPYY